MVLMLVVAAGLLSAGPVRADGEAVCDVRYVSVEHVYLDAGRLVGLEVGTTVRVVRDGADIAELVVVYAADHSASCRVETSTLEVAPGDRAYFVSALPPSVAVVDTVVATRRQRDLRPPATRAGRAASPGPRVTGSAAVRVDQTTDTGVVGLSSTVWNLPFRLRVRGLGRGWEFRARGNLRRILRDGFGPSTDPREWRNRIHEIALVRDDRRENWNFAVGRITTRMAAAGGPLDGLAVNRRVGQTMRVGAFGGFAPAWQDYNLSISDHVVGLTFGYDTAGALGRGLHLNLAGVGRYHEKEISREYLALTTTWQGAHGLSLLQAAEVDFNRGWRQAHGESAVELTSFALGGRWRVNRTAALRIGWDNREPVRTWESRAIPDSLFRNAGRRGLNAGVELRSGGGHRLWLNGAVRTPESGAKESNSWNVRTRLPRLPVASMDLDLSVRGFDGPYLAGLAPMAGLAWRGGNGWYARVAGGIYQYRDTTGDDERDSTWLSAGVDWSFARSWSALAELRGDWGDAVRTRSILLELRLRF